MDICQLPGCESKAEISCSCNQNLKLCIEHFVKHKDSLSQHVHNPIIILDIKNKITQAVKEKNEMMLNTKTFLILNANEMIKEIIIETKRLCDEIDKEFDKIKFAIFNPNETTLSMVKKMKISFVGADINGFISSIKNYLNLSVNDKFINDNNIYNPVILSNYISPPYQPIKQYNFFDPLKDVHKKNRTIESVLSQASTNSKATISTLKQNIIPPYSNEKHEAS